MRIDVRNDAYCCDLTCFPSFSGQQEDFETTLPRRQKKEGSMRSLPITDVAYLKSRRYCGAAAAHCGYYVWSKPPTIDRNSIATRYVENEKGGIRMFIYARGPCGSTSSVHSHTSSLSFVSISVTKLSFQRNGRMTMYLLDGRDENRS